MKISIVTPTFNEIENIEKLYFEIKKTKYLKNDFYVPSTKLAKKKLKLKITIDFKDAINLLIHQK